MNGDLLVQLIGGGGLVVLVTAIVNTLANRRKLRSESGREDADATQVLTTASSEVIKNLREDIAAQRAESVRQREESKSEIEELRKEVKHLREQIEKRDEEHRSEMERERTLRRAAEERADRHATSLSEVSRMIVSEAYRTAAADLLRGGEPTNLGPLPTPDPEADLPLPPHAD